MRAAVAARAATCPTRVPCERWGEPGQRLSQSQRPGREACHTRLRAEVHPPTEWLRLALRSGPTTVLVLSLLFIAFVVLLHIWGKFRRG